MSHEVQPSVSHGEVATDWRKSPHIGVHSRSFFAGEHIDGEGTVIDLSTTGCRILSETSVQPGTLLKLWLYLPDHGSPMKVQLAEVRWTRGWAFGVEFHSMLAEDQQRLNRELQVQAIAACA